jgi:transcriptional regulator with XRE-family HTH domain
MSLTSVARRLGVSPSALSQIETGVMPPSVSRLVETSLFAYGEVDLGAGDAIHFPATTGHRVVNRTPSVAVATWLTVGTRDAGGAA